MKIMMVGTGYVGLVTGTCLSEIGHQVVCIDNNTEKVKMLKDGEMPIYEPGLDKLVAKNVKAKRLSFSTSIADSIQGVDAAFIAVGTPPRKDGSADLSYIENVARQIATHMTKFILIVEKSTVPVETCEWIKKTVLRYNKNNVPFEVVSNPEFLREGSAVEDFLKPDRVVVGCESDKAREIMGKIYEPLTSAPVNAQMVFTDPKSSELIKHASNSFLAMKISYINSVANLCEKVGANVEQVAQGMGFDKRIGRAFLNAGCGFGGFCFPKDLEAFLWISKKLGVDFDLLESVRKVNEDQKVRFVHKIEEALWIVNDKKIAVLGLAFKPNTDDMRLAPSIDIVQMLQERGAKITAFDPISMPNAKKVLKDITFKKSAMDALKDADCAVILTEWDEFKKLDLKKAKSVMSHPTIIDGRNLFDPQEMKKLGFQYHSIGRKSV